MGRGHAASGMAAGAASASWALPAAGLVVPGGAWATGLLGVILAGWSLAPDIDHDRATATTAFGPVSRLVQPVVAKASHAAIRLTGTKRDEPREHRGLTHSVPAFAVPVAIIIWQLGEHWSAIVTAAVFAISVAMLVRLATKPIVSGPVGVAAGVLLWLTLQHHAGPHPALIGAAAGLGCAVHVWGDWITRQGVPAWAPLVKIKGKRWWNFRPPLAMTFKAGSKVENRVVVGFWIVTVLALAHAGGIV
jgi:membrane-bound metal-dependent hydrolase YbcI (DUF457 family)